MWLIGLYTDFITHSQGYNTTDVLLCTNCNYVTILLSASYLNQFYYLFLTLKIRYCKEIRGKTLRI